MKYFALVLIICSSFLSFTCSKNNITAPPTVNKDTLVTSLNPIWGVAATNDKTWNSGYEITEPVIDGQNVLVSTVFNTFQVFKMLNAQTGNEIWHWDDYYKKDTYVNFDYRISFPLIKDHKMVWLYFNEIYYIDLITGHTIWKNVTSNRFGFQCKGIGDHYFIELWNAGDHKDLEAGEPEYEGNLNSPNVQFLALPKYDTTNSTPNTGRSGVILGNAPFINPSGDTMLVVSYGDPPVTQDYLFRDAFGVYNLSKNKWQIERVLIGSPARTGIDFTPIVKDGKVFHCKTGLVTCHDVNTGDLLWTYDQIGHANFLFSGILVENGKVFANAGNGILHCMDAATGKLLWQAESAGSCSDMAYLNGIVYFVGGSDELLHAVDETTGKTIWKIVSPDDGKAINKISGTFTRFCAVVPGINGAKGRIVTHTGYNIYCFEAAK